MRKIFIIVSGLILILAAASCNRKNFEKKLVGTWELNRYLYSGTDESAKRRDTLMDDYKLEISEGQSYLETWQSLVFTADTAIVSDTIGFDTVNSVYFIDFDTVPFVRIDTTPHGSSGRWDLLNSEADLQLKDAATSAVRIHRILKLTNSNLDLRNGNEEMYLTK